METFVTAFPYLYLTFAIAFEVIGTSALKASDSFTRLLPSLVCVFAYAVSFLLLALSLRTIPVGIAYAMWAGRPGHCAHCRDRLALVQGTTGPAGVHWTVPYRGRSRRSERVFACPATLEPNHPFHAKGRRRARHSFQLYGSYSPTIPGEISR